MFGLDILSLVIGFVVGAVFTSVIGNLRGRK